MERYINQYIQNLPDASTDPEALELDSAAVLKSIEAQHGLFVERARGIYSFSHLTFHEYFTARKIVTNCNPYAADDAMLQDLVSHLTEKRWREVLLLTVGMLDSADALLQLIKAQIDGLTLELAKEEKLQQFLGWVMNKGQSIEVLYKPAAVRAYYFANSASCTYIDFKLAKSLGLDVIRVLDNAFDLALDRAFDLIMRFTSGSVNWDYSYTFDIARILDCILDSNLELRQKLKRLREQLPDPEIYKQWWEANGSDWTEQLKLLMIEHRNIGHDWQFSKAQKKRLQQYYDANKLLVDCLNLPDIYLSRELRQEIEETLLLPIAEIEKR